MKSLVYIISINRSTDQVLLIVLKIVAELLKKYDIFVYTQLQHVDNIGRIRPDCYGKYKTCIQKGVLLTVFD